MADVWNGDILLADDTPIKDISLVSNGASHPVIVAPAFRFIASVDTARVPLCLAAGPSLDVWTTDEATQEWFASVLLSKTPVAADVPGDRHAGPWWAYARAQSPIGILVKVDAVQVRSSAPRITELLFYGTIAPPAQGPLPTPPSSSPELPYAQPERLPELTVHALPLSSDIIHQNTLSEAPPVASILLTAESLSDVDARFLPSLQAHQSTPGSPKRKRDLFDEAAKARKKARGKAAEDISAAAVKTHESQRTIGHRKSLSVDTKAVPSLDSRPNSAHSVLAYSSSRPLSRSPSLASESRPLSRKDPLEGQARRSTLSRVATVSLQPEEPNTEARNKEALSRVVMAAMRMHGLQQRKKSKSQRNSVAPGLEAEQLSREAATEEAGKDEEYKIIYHQTYKGAVLALRKHITSKPLHSQPDRLRDVVEKLLAIFCTDPLTQPHSTNESVEPLATPGGKHQLGVPASQHSRTSPFDLPSGARVNGAKLPEYVHTGSPVSRRVKNGDV